jgi:hypothetical protein
MSPVWTRRARRIIAGERMRTPSSSPRAGASRQSATGRRRSKRSRRAGPPRPGSSNSAWSPSILRDKCLIGTVPRMSGRTWRSLRSARRPMLVSASSERREQVLVQQRLVIARPWIGADQRHAHQHVVDQRRIVARSPGGWCRGRGRCFRRTAPAAGRGTCPASGVQTPGIPACVGEQVEESRILARLAGEFGQHVAHLGGEREPAFLDRPITSTLVKALVTENSENTSS